MTTSTLPLTSTPDATAAASLDRGVLRWLAIVCLLIASMVVIGGITRLTDSGLSIVEWKPLHGVIPPLNEQEWIEEFAGYQQTTQFKTKFPNMSLGEFKWIFFWEYFHRLVGRAVGLVYFFPWIFFTLRNRIPRQLQPRLALGFLLGGSQGLLGWYMVKSGLAGLPYVSHLRLAAHLGLALFLFSFLFWTHQRESTKLNAIENPRQPGEEAVIFTSALMRLHKLCLIGLAVQIFYGACLAGLKAGYAFNTFPLMGGFWIPPGMDSLPSLTENLFFNPTTVQWIHRWWGKAAALLLLGLAYSAWRHAKKGSSSRNARALGNWSLILGAAVFFQFTLGVLTLITEIHLPLAVVHQSGATLLLLILVSGWARFGIEPVQKKRT